ncbi:MAG: acetyl-CoA hydrolase [Gammaproteobacteria bacterium]|nr:acetyl-CoA hydrolase [Gammaproteobacteria bacterium]MDH5583568.1 acetyl-CoA hydrolase [Gammaproteobacteria bacterium]
MSRTFQSATEIADALITMLGKTIVLGLPIGIGKAVHVADALFARAVSDASLSLTIFTGLTLSPPEPRAGLEARFAEPLVDRLYADWPTPAYVAAIEANQLPANIKVREFYLRPGAYLGNDAAQQNYASINYSHAVDELMKLGVNAVAQLVATHDTAPGKYSLSSNPEVTLDLLPRLEARRRSGHAIAIVGQVNRQLPYMFGDAELEAGQFDFILDSEDCQFPLFGLPNRQVTQADYATGMHVASLIPDGGTLQLGIGSLSDAVAHCLRLRHDSPEIFAAVLEKLPGGTRSKSRLALPVETAPFEKGLYASTEMMSDALLALFEHGLIRRPADEQDDTLIHGGFFIGSNAFYETLRQMPPERRRRINMTHISFVNTLFGDEARKRQQRQKARFVNETMMATLLGEAISDTLDDGRVVSGVGGQFDFVAMAHSLEDAHSILMLRASRSKGGATRSNIRWSGGHATVPRHHRDIFVTEYGIAATRGRTDMQVIDALLQITDSAFQQALVAEAKAARKVAADYRVPDDASRNSPRAIQDVFDHAEVRASFPSYPLGTDLTAAEQQLVPALDWLQSSTATAASKVRVMLGAIVTSDAASNHAALHRLGLDAPSGIGGRLQRKLVNYALTRTGQ